jgi:hypothetical protein
MARPAKNSLLVELTYCRVLYPWRDIACLEALQGHQQGLEFLLALPAVIQVVLDQGHGLCGVPAYQADFGKVIQVIKALTATELVWPGRDHFPDDLFECVSV